MTIVFGFLRPIHLMGARYFFRSRSWHCCIWAFGKIEANSIIITTITNLTKIVNKGESRKVYGY